MAGLQRSAKPLPIFLHSIARVHELIIETLPNTHTQKPNLIITVHRIVSRAIFINVQEKCKKKKSEAGQTMVFRHWFINAYEWIRNIEWEKGAKELKECRAVANCACINCGTNRRNFGSGGVQRRLNVKGPYASCSHLFFWFRNKGVGNHSCFWHL